LETRNQLPDANYNNSNNNCAEQTRASKTVFDVIIRGGTVLDGMGGEAVRTDIGIMDDRITALGNLSGSEAGQVIVADGLRVAPGFIDIHTHSDISAMYDPGQASAIGMGVTTQVVGNCGLALGFADDSAAFAFEKRWLAPYQARITWQSFGEHLRLVEDQGFATNYLPLAGHGTLRKRVVGLDERAPTGDEQAAMRRYLEGAMRAGAWGFTSGLEYPPSAYGDENELADLCEVVKAYGGFYATHLRNEGDTLVEAVQEALNVVERAGVPLQLSHHKAEGRANWGKVQTTLGMVDRARERGADVQLDQYPYPAFMTALSIQTLPRYALNGSGEDLTARLSDPVQRAQIAADMRAAHPEWDDTGLNSPWNNLVIGVCRGRNELQGRVISELARKAMQNPIEYVLDLLAETGGFVSAVNFAIDETDIATVLRHPYTMIGSDGVGTHPGGDANDTKIHPRAYGTFPRVLGRYVRELGILSEAEAVHKMTGLTAARLGVFDRGRIASGCYADVVVYDPLTINDCATFEAPHQFAVGIETVLVNGRLALKAGQHTDTLAGRVLRRQ
jgi:N-acyl-D-amino-acid deacylase